MSTLLLCLLPLLTFTGASKVPRKYCNEAMDTGSIPPLPTAATLIQVHVLHRHGARTKSSSTSPPFWLNEDNVHYNCTTHLLEGSDATADPATSVLYRKIYANHRNSLKGNCMHGQLVAAGVAQCQASGRKLFQAYQDFLPSTPVGHESEFHLRSDDCPRTLASGQALFSAMYPNISSVVPWITMDIGGDAETIAPNPRVCPALTAAFNAAMQRYRASPHYTNITIPLAQKVSVALNRTVAPENVGGLLDPLMSVQCATVPSSGGAPPPAFTPALQQQTIDEEVHRLYYGCNDTEVAKFGAGPLLGEILVFVEQAIAGDVTPKFIQWSGHDTGPMAPVLGALRIGGAEFPVFNDLLSIEVYRLQELNTRVGDAFGVRVIHDGNIVTGFIPGCAASVAGVCAWTKFQATVVALVPTASECGRTDDPEWWPRPSSHVLR